MDDFETLLKQGDTTYLVNQKGSDIYIDPTIQRADSSAKLTDLFKMISKLVVLTLKDLNVEFISQDDADKIIFPDKAINKNYISYIVKSRKTKSELKPRIRETVVEKGLDNESRIGEIYGQKFKSIVQFNFFSSSSEIVDEIMDRFEEMILVYTGYFKKQGIAEIVYEDQVPGEEYNILRQNLSVRSIQYYVETERLTVIFKEKIKEIEIMLSQKEE